MVTPVNPEGVLILTKPLFLHWAQPIAQHWIMRLGCAARQGREEWLRQIQDVKQECIGLRERCSFQGEVDAGSAECSATELLSMIENCYKFHCPFLSNSDERMSLMCVCRSILQALLPPGLTKWDMSCVNSDFMKELMVLSLPSLPSIKCLKVQTEAFSTCSWLLLNNIQLLSELQEFVFPAGCCTQILAELSSYCANMTVLDINSCKNVDDASVIHLLKLKNLGYLNIFETSITPKTYGKVLSALPNVKNITWSEPADDILMSVTKNRLSSVISILGSFRNAHILVQKCPFITKLTLLHTKCNLSELKDLIALTDLTVIGCNFDTINLFTILEGVGPRLRKLLLFYVTGLLMYAVTHFCKHLKMLEFDECVFTHSEHRLLHRLLLHFRNLAYLKVKGNFYLREMSNYLTCYIHLVIFVAWKTPQLNDVTLSFILMNKGFQELKVFSAHHCGPLTIKSAVLLIENCRNLSQLRGIGTWSGIKKEDIPNLLHIAMKANVHLIEV